MDAPHERGETRASRPGSRRSHGRWHQAGERRVVEHPLQVVHGPRPRCPGCSDAEELAQAAREVRRHHRPRLCLRPELRPKLARLARVAGGSRTDRLFELSGKFARGRRNMAGSLHSWSGLALAQGQERPALAADGLRTAAARLCRERRLRRHRLARALPKRRPRLLRVARIQVLAGDMKRLGLLRGRVRIWHRMDRRSWAATPQHVAHVAHVSGRCGGALAIANH